MYMFQQSGNTGICFSKSAVRAFSAVSSFCISSSAVERVLLHSSHLLLRIMGLHEPAQTHISSISSRLN